MMSLHYDIMYDIIMLHCTNIITICYDVITLCLHNNITLGWHCVVA